jgi:hypothetical protein
MCTAVLQWILMLFKNPLIATKMVREQTCFVLKIIAFGDDIAASSSQVLRRINQSLNQLIKTHSIQRWIALPDLLLTHILTHSLSIRLKLSRFTLHLTICI